ncbi:hypothetical protein HK405_001893, partial [Cladochytrium tenue]
MSGEQAVPPSRSGDEGLVAAVDARLRNAGLPSLFPADASGAAANRPGLSPYPAWAVSAA